MRGAFHQIEGLLVDEGVTLADLKGAATVAAPATVVYTATPSPAQSWWDGYATASFLAPRPAAAATHHHYQGLGRDRPA